MSSRSELSTAFAAVTRADLVRLVDDLPPSPANKPAPALAPSHPVRRSSHYWLWVLLPYLGAAAWVHAAVLTRSTRYWLLAAVYAVPLALSALVAPGVDDEIPNWVDAGCRRVLDRQRDPRLDSPAGRRRCLGTRQARRYLERGHIVSTESQQPPFAASTPYGATTPVLGVERSPNVVAVLTIVTLGLYLIYWWYIVNREMRDFARTVQPTHPLATSRPGTSTSRSRSARSSSCRCSSPRTRPPAASVRRWPCPACRRMTGPARRCTCSCSRSEGF